MNLRFVDVSFAYPQQNLFRKARAPVLEDLSWEMPGGRTVLLGPNGAGKTTLLSIAATALRPTRGGVILNGLDTRRRKDLPAIRRRVGWMPQQARAVPGFSGREQVAYAGWLKGMSRSDAWASAGHALALVGLSVDVDRLTAQLSGGQQRRVALAQLLVHRADVFVLDEPTAGLDPGQRARFREILKEISGGAPVVVSTHQVDDLVDLFDTVVVLDHGRIRFAGTIAQFMALAPDGGRHRGESAYAALISADR